MARDALVIGSYALLAVVFTWPAVTKSFSKIANLDPPHTAWSLWWVKEQLLSLNNPWQTHELLAPVGTYLAFDTISPLAGVVLAPVTAALGAGPTTNLTRFLVPALSSYVMYRLALRVGLPRWVSIVTGALYGCSSALIWRAAYHFNLAAGAIFPPLALLAAMRFRASGRRGDAVLLGVTLGAALLVDQNFFLYSVAVVMAYAVAVAYVDGREGRRHQFRGLVVAACVALAIASPQLWMMWRQWEAGQYEQSREVLATGWVAQGSGPTTLLAPAVPFEPRTGIDLGPWAHDYGEGASSYGWGLLLLATAGAILAFRRRMTRWLVALWLAAALLALGPGLVLDGHRYVPLPVTVSGQELSLLLPYTYMVQLPVLADLHVPARIGLVGMLPAALLAGLGLQALSARRGLWPKAMLTAAGVLTLLELGGPMVSDRTMNYDRLLAPVKADHSDSIVVDVPLIWAAGLGPYYAVGPRNPDLVVNSDSMPVLRATQHGHPIAAGGAARLDPKVFSQLAQNRFYTDLLVLQGPTAFGTPPGPTLLRTPPPRPPRPRAGSANARALGVGWVTVWPGVSRRVLPYLRKAGFEPVAEERGALLFKAGWD
ncbi:MAG: hypothetical protein AABM29_02615 [Actinomycetota bacterium]